MAFSSEQDDTSLSGEPALELPAWSDTSADDLREILLRAERERSDDLSRQVADLERQVTDKEALIALLMPVLGDVLRQKIRDARAEMIEALYPIIGEVVVRAVSEAIRDLARSVDAQMRTSLTPSAAWRRTRARLGGVSDGEMILRQALPFAVAEIFLIQRPTGLLLWYASPQPAELRDSDVISGMLTAIRDFAQDAFGAVHDRELDEIQYGDRRIVIEAAQHVYLAVVVDGIEPPGFRAHMRSLLIDIQNQYEEVLRDYDGDASPLAPVETPLRSLFTPDAPTPTPSQTLTSGQKRILFGAVLAVVLCLALTCVAARAIAQWANNLSKPTVIYIEVTPPLPPTATSTPIPSPSPTPTAVPTATPTTTSTPTATPTPQAFARSTAGMQNLRRGPGLNYAVIGSISRGQRVEILKRNDTNTWYYVCCSNRGVAGWVFAGLLTLEESGGGRPPTATPVSPDAGRIPRIDVAPSALA